MSARWRSACAMLLTALACAQPVHPIAGSRQETLRGQLIPTQEIEDGFFAHQRLRFRSGEHTGSVGAVVQLECDRLTIVALTPIGTRLFTIQQRGLEVHVDPNVLPDWPLSPLDVLLDVHRSLLYPVAEPPLADGQHAVRVRGVETVEIWEQGRLRERIIPEVRGEMRGRFSIRYEGDGLASGGRRHAHLESELYQYAIDVETIEARALDCSD